MEKPLIKGREYHAYNPGYIHHSAKIGRGTRIGAGHDIGKNVVIGENCLIQCHVSIPNGTVIGDRVFIGPGVKMANDKYMLGVDAKDDSHLDPPVICDDARIGLGALIGAGVHVGENAFIAQGSNVVKSVARDRAVMGNPAEEFGVIVDGKLVKYE